jgi:hypothetical protein
MPDEEIQLKPTEKPLQILETAWQSTLETKIKNHRFRTLQLLKYNRLFVTLNVVFAAITATTVWAAMNKQMSGLIWEVQILITFISVLPAISAGLQKELQFSARIQAHAALTKDCTALLENLKFLLTLQPDVFQSKIEARHAIYTEAISRSLISV